MAIRKKKVPPPAFSEEQLKILLENSRKIEEFLDKKIKLLEQHVEDMLTPKEVKKEPLHYVLIGFEDSDVKIQIDKTEYQELPEILSKWLKKQGIDNRLVIIK